MNSIPASPSTGTSHKNLIRAKFFFRLCLYSYSFLILTGLAAGTFFSEPETGLQSLLILYTLSFLIIIAALSGPLGLIFIVKSLFSKETASGGRRLYLIGLLFFCLVDAILILGFISNRSW
jgi:hypothetical protein